jgi:hypothetical protein
LRHSNREEEIYRHRHHTSSQDQSNSISVIDEYACLLHKKEDVMTLLKERLTESVNSPQQHSLNNQSRRHISQPMLGICTTVLMETAHMFPFLSDPIQDSKQLERLLKCGTEASCHSILYPWIHLLLAKQYSIPPTMVSG